MSGLYTPWGEAISNTPICRGVNYYKTKSKGGIKVSDGLNFSIPTPFRSFDGWYEDGVPMNIPLAFLEKIEPEDYEKAFSTDPKNFRRRAKSAVKKNYKLEWQYYENPELVAMDELSDKDSVRVKQWIFIDEYMVKKNDATHIFTLEPVHFVKGISETLFIPADANSKYPYAVHRGNTVDITNATLIKSYSGIYVKLNDEDVKKFVNYK